MDASGPSARLFHDTRPLLASLHDDDPTAAPPEPLAKISDVGTLGEPERVLPIALLAALAMSSTAATAYFAYASLLCKDPRHCDGDETSRYAGAIAVSTSIANVFGMLSLGYLQALSLRSRKLGLTLWIICRSMSPVMLLVGVITRSISVALTGRLFEGLASDNLLHFNLNAVYAQAANKEKTSSMINYSLALYMVGISVSPFVTGLFHNFVVSFFIALGLFTITLTYLHLFVPGFVKAKYPVPKASPTNTSPLGMQHIKRATKSGLETMLAPVQWFRVHPACLPIGISLFAFNIVQSYVFNLLLIYTSIRFGFTGRENGSIITIAHSVASLYILLTLYLLPLIFRAMGTSHPISLSLCRQRREATLATIALLLQAVALASLSMSYKAWHVYTLTAVLALSLPASSLIKGYLVGFFEGSDKSAALAALAMMETLGSVLGPLILGGIQTYLSDSRVFLSAAVISLFSLGSFAFDVLARMESRS